MKTLLKRRTLIAIVFALLLFFVARKAIHYAEDPAGEKDCPPLFPELAKGDSPPIRVEVRPAAPSLPWSQKGGTVNDVSCLNRTPVYGVVRVAEIEDIKNALLFAKDNNLKVSVAGVKHSMGGHAFYKNAIVLDMAKFNKMSLDAERKVVTVQSGATWHDIQNLLHPKFAVKAMQSTDIFTVGGSISVNAHGMDHRAGSIANTIRSLRVMLPDGSVKRVSRAENPELFHLVVGGYGLFGVILDAEVDVTENVIYQRERKIISYRDFPEMFDREINGDERYGLFYGHLSTAPLSFLDQMILYGYRKAENQRIEIPPLAEVESVKLRRLMLNLAKLGQIGIKWFAEKYIEPWLEDCSVSRNQAQKEGEACLVSRNEPMHDSVKYLRNNLENDTDILHEYFIPRRQFLPFIDGMRKILRENHTHLLNASVRVVHREDIALTYAPADMFSIVLYINQRTDDAANEKMRKTTRELIDLTIGVGGRFFLPYQLHYTPEQLEKSYPEIRTFFEAKKRYDPQGMLTNTFYEKYARELTPSKKAS